MVGVSFSIDVFGSENLLLVFQIEPDCSHKSSFDKNLEATIEIYAETITWAVGNKAEVKHLAQIGKVKKMQK